MNRRDTTRKRAFTLIELLVVIAVIALLIGILLPALGKARAQGQSAKCQGHMRQYGTAHQIYVTDYDVMPGLGKGEGSSDPDSPEWITEVGVFDSDELGISVDPASAHIMNQFSEKYLKDPRVTTCPADPQTRWLDIDGGQYGALNGRVGNMLVPDEDPKAVGSCMTRLWFNFNPQDPPPPDYVVRSGLAYVTIGGITESHWLQYLRPGRLTLPAQSADAVEEDEASLVNNSVFVAENSAWGYPPTPLDPHNVISDNHPAGSGNIVYHDGHVSNIPNIVQRYWAEPSYETRVEIIWWPYYKDNDDDLP